MLLGYDVSMRECAMGNACDLTCFEGQSMEMISRSWCKCCLEKWSAMLDQIGNWRGLEIGCVRKKTSLVVMALKRDESCV
jgi:hypothetical protein